MYHVCIIISSTFGDVQLHECVYVCIYCEIPNEEKGHWGWWGHLAEVLAWCQVTQNSNTLNVLFSNWL